MPVADRLPLRGPGCYTGYDGNIHGVGRIGNYENLSAFRQSGLAILSRTMRSSVFHTVNLIQEPPAGAILHLARNRTVVEAVDRCHQQLVVARVQVVENRLCQHAFFVQTAQETGQRSCNFCISNRIVAGIGA